MNESENFIYFFLHGGLALEKYIIGASNSNKLMCILMITL